MRLIHATAAATLCLAIAACGQEPETAADTTEPAEQAAQAPDAATTDAAPAPSQDAPQSPPMSTADASPDAATLGQADAPVTIVEYASTTCPHCANFHATLFPHIRETWIDTGQAKLIMRPLPTAPAQLAVAGFLTARCAGEGEAYFAALGDLFETQNRMFEAAQSGELQAYFEGLGADHDVTPAELEQCFADEEGLAQINASITAAQADMVAVTPSFVINGTTYSAAALQDAASWDQAVQAALDAGPAD